MLRGLVIAAACALLLAIVPAGASAATPRLSSLQAQDLARTAKGVSAIAVKNPLAQWSWWLVLTPFALAAVWWTWADATGYTKRKAMEQDDKRRDERRTRTKEALDANFSKRRR